MTLQQARVMANLDPCDTAFFVSVPESALSTYSGGPQTPRVACEPLRFAQSLVRSDIRFRVFLVQQARTFTGIDVAAALLAGIAGIVDDRLLIVKGVLSFILSHKPFNRKGRTMLMLGETSGRFIKIKEMLEEWENDEHGNELGDFQCFRAAMALSQIDRLRPLRGPRDHMYSFVILSQALNLAESKTSFYLNKNDLRKTLSRLADRLIGLEHDHTERIRLPDYARIWDFPLNPPAIEGIDEKSIAKRLYNLYPAAQVERNNTMQHAELWTAHLPSAEFRHLTHRNPNRKGNSNA